MKYWIGIKNLTLVFGLFFLLTGCNAKEPFSVELVFGLKSYSNIDELKSIIVKNNSEWRILEKEEFPASNNRPQYKYVRVATNFFEEAGFSGESILAFYNDQLMAVMFYPKDWKSYHKHISSKYGVSVNEKKWELTSNNVRVWLSTDYAERNYVAWEDVNISKAVNEWIAKYS